MKTTTRRPTRPTASDAAFPKRIGGGTPLRNGQGGLRLGKCFGIDITIEGSWFVILTLLMISIAGNLSAEHPSLAAGIRWTLAVGTSLLFFGSILLHELAHSVVARRRGIHVHGITLMLFGGVSHLGSEPKRARDDLAIAIVGPLTSALIGVLFLAAARLMSPLPIARSMASWLGFINLALAAFNLLPGFPLDGGRILKALIWKFTGDAARAHRLAIGAGQVMAYGMILTGVFLAFGLRLTLDGIWIGFMGWYLLSAAQSSRLQLTLGEILKQHLVGDVLRPPDAVVGWDEPLADVVDAWVLKRGHRTLVVCEGGRLLGLVTLQEIKQVPRSEWEGRTVGQIMIPAGRLVIAVPEQNLFQAFQRMNERPVNQLPVVSNGKLIGVLTREDVLRVLAIRSEMNH